MTKAEINQLKADYVNGCYSIAQLAHYYNTTTQNINRMLLQAGR